ncbi:type IV pilin-like G/H family protein [Capilliphycus salinus ALCB114379]|uniref:type IV pilin-like G/H family protein n=1 Tax=Capilliphycus salinus TaxID=2768948 RepID=UPI0039A520C6
MKTEFKAKFLQHVAKRKKEEGFTLIELLVVIIIIGILSAIALPSFLNQANKAKESEAKQYLSAINKGQQAFYTENGKFTEGISSLGVGIKTATENYTYQCEVGGTAIVNCTATPLQGSALRGYLGAVYLIQVDDQGGGEATSRSVLCQSKDTGEAVPKFGGQDGSFQADADPKCATIDMEDV